MKETIMNFKPLHDRILARRVEQETKSSGGIIIPDNAQEKPIEGDVISVGAGRRDDQGNIIPMDVKAGDRIVFGKWSGTEIKLDGQEYVILKESDIFGIKTA
jgi:chaperonin GroES